MSEQPTSITIRHEESAIADPRIEVSDYVNVHQKLEGLGAHYPAAGMTLLPLNLATAGTCSELRHAAETATIKKLLLQSSLPFEDILDRDRRPSYIKNKSAAWVLPAVFISYSLWQQNPGLVSIALNLISSYAYDYFKGSLSSRSVKLDIVIEKKDGSSRLVSYSGPIGGLKEIPAAIKAAAE